MWKDLNEVLWMLEAVWGHYCGNLQRIPAYWSVPGPIGTYWAVLYWAVPVPIGKICSNVQRHCWKLLTETFAGLIQWYALEKKRWCAVEFLSLSKNERNPINFSGLQVNKFFGFFKNCFRWWKLRSLKIQLVQKCAKETTRIQLLEVAYWNTEVDPKVKLGW